jgi:hypothetical protein
LRRGGGDIRGEEVVLALHGLEKIWEGHGAVQLGDELAVAGEVIVRGPFLRFGRKAVRTGALRAGAHGAGLCGSFSGGCWRWELTRRMQGPDAVVGSVRASKVAADARVVWLLQSAARRPQREETRQKQMHHPSFPSTLHTQGGTVADLFVLCRSFDRAGASVTNRAKRRLQHYTRAPRGHPEAEALQGRQSRVQVGNLPAANCRQMEPNIGIPVIFGREQWDGQSSQKEWVH